MAMRIDLVKDVQDLLSKATGGIVPPAPDAVSGGSGGVQSPIPALPTIQVPVVVTKTTNKPIGFKERIKGSYKAIAAFIGALLTLATQIQFLTPWLPAQSREWIGAAVAFLTAISTFLVRNETWVDNL